MTDDAAPPPRNLAMLKGLTAFLGLLLFAGVILLVALLVLRGRAADAPPPVASVAVGSVLRPGERIAEQALGPDGMSLVLTGPEGERVVFLLPAQERVVTFRLSAPDEADAP